MILPKPLRVVGILGCGALLAAPTIACFHLPLQGQWVGLDVIRTLFPIWFYLLVQICIDEGRARERERTERALEKKV